MGSCFSTKSVTFAALFFKLTFLIMLIQFLREPFPALQNKWHSVLVTVVCIVTVLTVVASFLQEKVTFSTFMLFLCVYGAITALCSTFVICLLPVMFKRFFDKKQRTKGKYFINCGLIALTIGVANSAFNYVMDVYSANTIQTYSYYVYANLLNAFIVGIIPTTAVYFLAKDKILRSALQENEDRNRLLLSRFSYEKDNAADAKIVTLSGNSKEALTLFPNELIYIEASGNYVNIHYAVNRQIAEKTLRATLLQMEEQLNGYPFLVRCHRAFIVNMDYIENIKGSKIRLKSTKTEIPVSKTCKNNLIKQDVFVGHRVETPVTDG
jgi:hypothetical protein